MPTAGGETRRKSPVYANEREDLPAETHRGDQDRGAGLPSTPCDSEQIHQSPAVFGPGLGVGANVLFGLPGRAICHFWTELKGVEWGGGVFASFAQSGVDYAVRNPWSMQALMCVCVWKWGGSKQCCFANHL